MRGKSIKLYIMGEKYKNLKTAELSNWTGKAYIGQRKHVQILQNIEELASPGIYLLISELEDSYQKRIYIGEADEVNGRLSEQFKKKDWWSDFVIFISKDTNLTKSHVRYLERELYEIAIINKTTIETTNGNTPPGSKLPTSECDDMDDFNENIIFVLSNLGILDFTKTQVTDEDINNRRKQESDIFYLNVPGAEGEVTKEAKLIIVEGTYRLLSGSYIRKDHVNSFASHNYAKLKKQLEEEGFFEPSESESYFKLCRHVDFKSPSAAAAIVRNSSMNGRKEWRLKGGVSLDEYENRL
ncbi:GIY-YIG nuclease family protein [Paenibacillus macerans]|uniref:GIY-YIG nuclease family protein n=1 Tax=Paenibacillus macerans TaxID=44252 RepID=UPI002DBB6DDD|nr:GIY-YIG nuclease family protein [Paenibacillus macerans]MEC0329130.1 GIY-YIG nuclease family protein [Paenibacillus macerans]MED4954236.1 GIY-YIG nuclease family protein [Paenibacillus macerans]